MPDLSGFDVMAKLEGRLPVVVITGHDSPEAETCAMGSRAAAYLRKPVNDRALSEVIREAITCSIAWI